MTHSLAIDVGNSGTKAAVFSDGQILRTSRYSADGAVRAVEQDLEGWLRELIEGLSVRRSAMVSVVPSVAEQIEGALDRAEMERPLRIGPELALPFGVAYQTPGTLGADRLAAAAAATEWLRAAGGDAPGVIAVDAGTALTLEIVQQTPEGPVYLGGAIAPGPTLLRHALAEGTAQLPLVALDWPDHEIGRSTVECMQLGIMAGFVDAVSGLLSRAERRLGGSAPVLLTGGWAGLLAERMDRHRIVDPDLVLRGVQVIAALNDDRQ